MPVQLKTILSVAGSDPTGGAGIQADIRGGILMGLHVMTAITAVTAQNSRGISQLGTVPSEMLEKQLDSILFDATPDAVKIGMIGSMENAGVIKNFIEKLPPETPIVVDPVFASSAGEICMFDESGIYLSIYREFINPLATVVTPNLKELSLLIEDSVSISINEIPSYLNTEAVVIKGGHSENDIIEDVLILKDKILTERHSKIDCHNTHGTGCLFSSLLASFLAIGNDLEKAFIETTKLVYNIISNSNNYKLGNSSYGPLNINSYKL